MKHMMFAGDFNMDYEYNGKVKSFCDLMEYAEFKSAVQFLCLELGILFLGKIAPKVKIVSSSMEYLHGLSWNLVVTLIRI